MTAASDWLRRGLDAHRAGDLSNAAECYQRAIDLADDADAWHMLGMLHHQAGAANAAFDCLAQALRQRRDDPAILANRAAVKIALGDFAGAYADAEQATLARPSLYAAWFNLALAAEATARWDQALAALQHAQALRPGASVQSVQQRCAFALARALSLGGHPSKALDAWRQYFDAGGDAADAWLLRANAASDLGRHDDSIRYLANARERAPDSADYASAELIALCYQPGTKSITQTHMAREWGRVYCADIASDPLPIRRAVAQRIGFYSPRFAAGPIASLVLPLLKVLHERGIGIYLYAGFDHQDDDTPRFAELARAWRYCADHTDAALVLQARVDALDVMVDLCGHAPGNRLRAFAQRMAPLQLSWGDWFASTGVPNMDLFFGDPVLTPAAEDYCFSERVLRLPHTRFVYAPPPSALLIEPSPRSEQAPIRFASFNRLSKLTDQTIACWAKILGAVAGSELYLRAAALDEDEAVIDIRRRFAAHGIAPARLLCKGFGSYAEILADYASVDVALDPFPFNGCVTTLDALWMGIPVIALHGKCLAARQSAALLAAHGFAQWVAEHEDDYLRIAVDITRSRAALAEFGGALRAARSHSVLFDAHRFADDWLGQLGRASVSTEVAPFAESQ